MSAVPERDSNADEVIVGHERAAARITLNRPAALNALTLNMVRLIQGALDRFATDEDVAVVVFDAAGDRAFCAGGDIRSIYDAALAGDPAPRTFWREEYRLNSTIAHYRKPIVVAMDGIVMGGGVGIAAHASHRVVTERSTVAMPEVGIGFAPDVGGTWLLSRAPGEVGTHLALTAGRVGAADAIYCGLADHHVTTDDLDALVTELASGDADTAIEKFSTPAGAAPLDAKRDWIDACYSADSVSEIVRLLLNVGGAAADTAGTIASMSPTSLAVTLRALREARVRPTLESCLEMEYRISTTFLDTPDFIEGVRAAVVDKDRTPRWNPAEIDAVSAADVDHFFTRRPDDLDLGAPSPTITT